MSCKVIAAMAIKTLRWQWEFQFRILRNLLIVTFTTYPLGCASDHSDGFPAPEGFSVTDSLGVEIVVNHSPAWTHETRWTVDGEPALVIATDTADPRSTLYRIGNIEVFSDGRVAIENRGTREILIFGQDGRLVDVWGGRGEGPGEFRYLRGLFLCGRDTLMVFGGGRVVFFDGMGEMTRSLPLLLRSGDVSGASSDCEKLLVEENLPGWSPPHRDPAEGLRPFDEGQGYGFTAVLLRWVSTTEERADTLGVFRRRKAFGLERRVQGRNVWAALPFTAEASWATDGGQAFYGLGETAEFQVLGDRGALLKIVRWGVVGGEATDAEWDAYARDREARLESSPSSALNTLRRTDYPDPQRKPVYSSDSEDWPPAFRIDDEGNLWVLKYYRPSLLRGSSEYRQPLPLATWWVFSPAGEWLGEVDTPPNFSIRAIRLGFLLGVSRNEFDVEEVRLYRINKSQGTQ